VPSFTDDFEGRLMALSRAHDVLTRSDWASGDLQTLFAQELLPLSGNVSLDGPGVELAPGAALAVGLIVHELATNALKHGALRSPGGAVAIAWTLGSDGRVTLDWRERGGGPTAPPSRVGFGSRLIAKLVDGDLKGVVAYDFGDEGLSCRLTFNAAPGPARGAPELTSKNFPLANGRQP
jgi:two-component sensor histidine kinase